MPNHTSNTHTVKDHNNNNVDIEVYRIDNCVNGNPRFVVHFLPFFEGLPDNQDIGSKYQAVVRLFNKSMHGRKYTAKWFGGGIVFSSYNIKDDLTRVFEVKREMIAKHKLDTYDILLNACKKTQEFLRHEPDLPECTEIIDDAVEAAGI